MPSKNKNDVECLPALTVWGLAKIHWKTQALAHFLYGMPMGLLAVYSWGLPLAAPLGVAIVYSLLYLAIFVPSYFFLSWFELRPIRREMEALERGEKLKYTQVQGVVQYLMNMPLQSALRVLVMEFIAFSLGAAAWVSGVVPDLLSIIGVAVFETYMLWFVTGLNKSLLTYSTLETKVNVLVEGILERYPERENHPFQFNSIPLYKKVLFTVMLASLVGELSILLFFTSFLLTRSSADEILFNLGMVVTVMIFGAVNVLVISPQIARNMTLPISKMIDWSRQIVRGQSHRQLTYLTNDETADLIRGTNKMVQELDQTTEKLQESVQALAQDKALLSAERDKFEAVLDGMPDGVMALDSHLRITYINKTARKLFDARLGSSRGKPASQVIHLVDSEERPVLLETLLARAGEQTEMSTISKPIYTIYRKQEGMAFVEVTTVLLSTGILEDARLILTFHDVTKERELDAMKLDFVAMAEHELRTPMTAINGYLSMFMLENKDKFDSEQQSLLTSLDAASKRLNDMVDNLLNVSQIARHDVRLDLRVCDWSDELAVIVEQYQEEAHAKGLKLVLKKTTGLPAVRADARRIQEVLSNLVSNAIHYSKKGTITVWADRHGEEVWTHVRDEGIGIPKLAQAQLFTKFYRVGNPYLHFQSGRGLGLFISKALVDLHHGCIWCTSTSGVGSTFHFALPLE